MTVPTTVNRTVYLGAGIVGPFATGFPFIQNADVKAIKTLIATGVATALVEGPDYTLVQDPATFQGTLNLTVAIDNTYKLTIYRDPAATQNTSWPPNDKFPAKTTEQAVDRLTMLVQRFTDLFSRGARFADSDISGADPTLPTPVAGSVLGWDATALKLQNYIQAGVFAISAYGQTLINAANAAAARALLLSTAVGDAVFTAVNAGAGLATLTTQQVAFTGVIAPAQIAADTNDYNPANLATTAVLRLSTDAARKLTGLSGGAVGRLVYIANVGANDLILTNEDAGSVAANRFNLNASRSFTIRPSTMCELQYDGTASRWRVVNREHWSGTVASGRNINCRTNAATPNTKIDINADEIVLRDANGNSLVAQTVAGTIDFGVVGANGIDAGVQALSTWYYGWVIAKPDGTVAVLGSLSNTAPTLPAGYTFKALVTAMRSNGSTQFVKYRQFGNEVFYEAQQNVLSAGAAATETSVSTASFVPPIALVHILWVEFSQSFGTAATNWRARVRYISASDYEHMASGTQANGGVTMYNHAQMQIPNVGQQFFYLVDNFGGSTGAGALSIFVIGFKLPLGGE